MGRRSLRHFCICTKPVTQILSWMLLITAIYYSAYLAWPLILKTTQTFFGQFWTKVAVFAVLSFVFMLSPVGGFFGDVYLGRYQAVQFGLVLAVISTVTGSIISLILLIADNEGISNNDSVRSCISVLVVITLLVFGIGLSAFSSNVTQFGMDQLMEKPNESQGVFVHWLAWTCKVGEAFVTTLFVTTNCDHEKPMKYAWHAIPTCYLILLIALLIVSYCTKQLFNRDRVKYNPYKMIFKVFNFARKNKYPVGPVSAFAHCYDIKPSRLDYAKERYGGPFTTSDVEDVKTFARVLLVLITLGPVFVLDVPLSTVLFDKFSLHIGAGFPFSAVNASCKSMDVGVLSDLSAVVTIPIYIWFIYSVFRNRPPKILHRLGFLVFLYILTVVSMLVTDLTGHLMLLTEQDHTQTKCMFVAEEEHTKTLNLHWMVLILPIILKSTLTFLISATGFEFISAQSPHTMKGVLVGTLLAIISTFRCFSVIILVPFALDGIWKDGYLGQNPPVISCGFGYYLVCITVASVGLIIFIIAVKKYKYRKREEEPFSQACVEEIFTRRIEERSQYKELPGTNTYTT